MFRHPRSMRLVAAVMLGVLVCGLPDRVHAADEAAIQRAIERGKKYLFSQNKSMASGSLACYSLVKTGVDKQHPDIQRCVQEVLAMFRDNTYFPASQHNYEAGVDAMLLEAIDRELYRPQLEMISQYLVNRQRPHGAWYYPASEGNSEFGDTSITQYAILGLWAAARADVDVPTETWERAARWLILTQRRDGGFGYHPMDPSRTGNSGLDTMGTMSVAGTGSLLVIRHVLFRDAAFDDDLRSVAPSAPVADKRFGVLDRLSDEKEKKARPKVKTNPTMSVSTFDKAIKEGVKWNGDHFADSGALATYGNYYFYGVERMGALLDVEKIGTHDWYNEGADELLRKQAPDGSWVDSCGNVASTALTLLFLSKATAGTINKPPKKRAPVLGGGLLVGGRGLPDNLDAVRINEGEVTKRKIHGPVDGLLAELEKSSGAKVEAAQEAVIEVVQLDNPAELIGQVDRLKRLAVDNRIEVRRTAMWALGRTGVVSVAPALIKGLSDDDEAVLREASAALCILSRRPNGCGLPIDPTDGLAEDASNEERQDHLKKWRTESAKRWTDWYLKVRPYDERDDRNMLKRKP